MIQTFQGRPITDDFKVRHLRGNADFFAFCLKHKLKFEDFYNPSSGLYSTTYHLDGLHSDKVIRFGSWAVEHIVAQYFKDNPHPLVVNYYGLAVINLTDTLLYVQFMERLYLNSGRATYAIKNGDIDATVDDLFESKLPELYWHCHVDIHNHNGGFTLKEGKFKLFDLVGVTEYGEENEKEIMKYVQN